jgi:hypothetical protein
VDLYLGGFSTAVQGVETAQSTLSPLNGKQRSSVTQTAIVRSDAADSCLHDGNVNQDGSTTPADALLAFQHFLGVATSPLDACQQNRANVIDPAASEITPADALCIFQRFLGLSSCLDALGRPARLEALRGNNV